MFIKKIKVIMLAVTIVSILTLPVFAASITPSTETFDLGNPKDWTFSVTGVSNVGMLIFYGNNIQLVGEVGGFTYDGTTLIVKSNTIKSAVSGHVGQYSTFKMNLFPSNVDVTFTVTDSSAKTISPTDVNYDLKNPKDLSFTLKNVDTIDSLSYYTQGGEFIETSTDFTYSGDTLTIRKEVLSTILSKDVPSAKSSATVYVYDIKINNEEPTARIYADHATSGGDSGGGGGCNAGFGVLSLLVCFGLLKKRKSSK